jgi:non-ribosomal peptide synthetase component E (peptide arylation enzyme)
MQLSLASMLADSAWRMPDRIAVIDGAEKVSYRDLWARSLARAAALEQLGVAAAGSRCLPRMASTSSRPTLESWPAER